MNALKKLYMFIRNEYYQTRITHLKSKIAYYEKKGYSGRASAMRHKLDQITSKTGLY